MSQMLSISKAADFLGVHQNTLREWDEQGKLKPVKTCGNHRRYRIADLKRLSGEIGEEPCGELDVAVYCRVSSHDQKQKGDLERQAGRMLTYCSKQGYHVVHCFEEVGSGMCATRPKLKQLFKLVCGGQIRKVVVEHKDRLTRFNFEFLKDFFESYGVEIEWANEVLGKTYEEELVEDILSLMSSFSNKIYGKRSAELKRQKKLLTEQDGAL